MSLKDKLFYIGYSEEVMSRFEDHQRGKNISTTNRRPLDLVFYEAYRSKVDALRREQYFKTTKGKTTIRQMIRDYLKENL